MALVLKDRVKQDTTTAGTGTITLSGTYLGYQSFSAIGNGNTTYYCIAGQGTNEWEVGIGTYTASGTTLSRDTILASSNAGSVVTFSAGTKDVFVVYPAGRSVNYNQAGTGVDVSGTLGVTGNTTLGDASTDTVTVNGYVGFNATPLAYRGIEFLTTVTGATNALGINCSPIAASDVTSTFSAIRTLPRTTAAAYTVSSLIGVLVSNASKGAGSAITEQIGVSIADQTQGTNNYGITSQVSSGANKYNIYASGTAQNYFAGDVGIGTIAPANRLDIVNSASSAQMSIAGSDGQFAGMFGGTGSNGPGIFFLNTAPALRFGTGTAKSLGSFAELMRLTAGGNLGLGVTPSSWGAGNKAFEQIGGFLFSGAVGNIYLGNNTYFDGTNWIYKNTAAASYYQQGAGAHYWFQAASGTAGNTITFTERMRLDSSGNLGIGTTSAGDKVSVGGAIRVTQDGSSVGVYLAGGLRHTGSSNFYIDSNTGGAAGNIIFRNGSGFAEQMRLSSAGNLGIGTTSPGYPLSVGDSTAPTNVAVISSMISTNTASGLNFAIRKSNDGTNAAGLAFLKSRGTNAAPTAVASGDVISQIQNYAYGGTNYRALTAIVSNVDTYVSDTNMSSSMVFYTTNASAGATERLRINPAGDVGIGTASPAYRLDVNAGVADFAARILNGGVSFSRQGLLLQGGNNTEFYGLSTRTADASCEFGFRIQAGSLPAVWSTTNHSIIFGNNNTERMRLDTSGNLGLGVTPSAWGPTQKAIQVSTVGSVACDSATVRLVNNAYFDGTNWVYLTTTTASRYQQTSGIHQWFTAPSGTAGNAITFTQAMTLDASGRLGIGTASPLQLLHLSSASTPLIQITYQGVAASQIGVVSGGALSFALDTSNGATERMRLDSSGNLGIGLTTVAQKLDVLGSGQFRPAATQDAVLISGRAGGTSSYAATITPTTLTANRTITLPDATTTVVGTDATQTLTNKRVNPRAVAAGATSGNLTPNGDTTDVFNAFGLTGAITMLAPSGTPVDGQRLMLRFEDNGTARGITWTTSSGAFRAVGITLPTTTVASKVTYVGCVYNSTDVFWDAVATVTQA